MTDVLGQSQVIPYLVGLTKYGYQFTILSCEKPGSFIKNKIYVEELLKDLPIKWKPIIYHKNPPVLSSIYDVIALKQAARKLHAKEKFAMVHTRPGVPALVGLWMKKKLRVPFLNDIREFYADSRVEGGMWDKKKIHYKIIYNYFIKKEKEAVEKNDGIVCLTHAAKKIIEQWPQYQKNKPLEIIPCSVDMNLFDPENIPIDLKNSMGNKLGIQDEDIIISYLGSIGGWYLTDEMMEFFKLLSLKIPAAKLLFISPHQHEIIFETAAKFGISRNRIIVTHAQRKEVPLLLSFSALSVFFIKPCYSKKSSSPTKHGEIMAMGIPVISNVGVGDVAEIIQKYQSGIILQDLSTQRYEEAISSITNGIAFDKAAIRNGAKEYYDLEKAVGGYLSVYEAILPT
jgi:glycosyltransferase involved in cell wall biosynthesis